MPDTWSKQCLDAASGFVLFGGAMRDISVTMHPARKLSIIRCCKTHSFSSHQASAVVSVTSYCNLCEFSVANGIMLTLKLQLSHEEVRLGTFRGSSCGFGVLDLLPMAGWWESPTAQPDLPPRAEWGGSTSQRARMFSDSCARRDNHTHNGTHTYTSNLD
jgi:hypothetical protein